MWKHMKKSFAVVTGAERGTIGGSEVKLTVGLRLAVFPFLGLIRVIYAAVVVVFSGDEWCEHD